MNINEVKQAHENFDMAEFMSREKEQNGAIVVINPNQLICCKTENDGEGVHRLSKNSKKTTEKNGKEK